MLQMEEISRTPSTTITITRTTSTSTMRPKSNHPTPFKIRPNVKAVIAQPNSTNTQINAKSISDQFKHAIAPANAIIRVLEEDIEVWRQIRDTIAHQIEQKLPLISSRLAKLEQDRDQLEHKFKQISSVAANVTENLLKAVNETMSFLHGTKFIEP